MKKNVSLGLAIYPGGVYYIADKDTPDGYLSAGKEPSPRPECVRTDG